MAELPTRREINVHDSLDERVAEATFLGKTAAEAEALFREDFFGSSEELMVMGPVAFRFYVVPALRAFSRELTGDDSDDLNSLCGVLEHRVEFEHHECEPIAEVLRSGVAGVLSRWPEVDPGIYGDLRGRFEALLERLGGSLGK